jgi:hypothetical protein
MREYKDIKALTDEETDLIRSTFPLNAFGGSIMEYRGDGTDGVTPNWKSLWPDKDEDGNKILEGAWTHFYWGLKKHIYIARTSDGRVMYSNGDPYKDGCLTIYPTFDDIFTRMKRVMLPENDEPNGARYWSVESWSRHGDDSQVHQTYKGALKTFYDMAHLLSDELPEDNILRDKSREEIEALPYEDIVNAFRDADDVGLMITAERFYDAVNYD